MPLEGFQENLRVGEGLPLSSPRADFQAPVPRSAAGQLRRIAHVRVMSASPLIPVELITLGDGSNGPMLSKKALI